VVYGKWKNLMGIFRYLRSFSVVISKFINTMLFMPDTAHPRQNMLTNGTDCGCRSICTYYPQHSRAATDVKPETTGNGIPTGKEV
jgi:hypothetical protein